MTGSGPPPPAAPPLPGWLGPIVTITTQVGVPTVIAGVLLWFVLFRLDTTLQLIERSEEDRVRIIAAVQDSIVAALDRQTHAFEQAIQDNIRANERLASQVRGGRPVAPHPSGDEP
jgi:hypothetical protein